MAEKPEDNSTVEIEITSAMEIAGEREICLSPWFEGLSDSASQLAIDVYKAMERARRNGL